MNEANEMEKSLDISIMKEPDNHDNVAPSGVLEKNEVYVLKIRIINIFTFTRYL